MLMRKPAGMPPGEVPPPGVELPGDPAVVTCGEDLFAKKEREDARHDQPEESTPAYVLLVAAHHALLSQDLGQNQTTGPKGGRRSMNPVSENAEWPFSPPITPMEAEVADELPAPPGWGYEPKWDGFRVVMWSRSGTAGPRLDSRNAKPLLRYFPELRPALEQLPAGTVADGEVVVVTDGKLDFDALQNRIHPAESRVRRLSEETPARLALFDLLAVAGQDLRARPLRERRQLLEELRRLLGAERGRSPAGGEGRGRGRLARGSSPPDLWTSISPGSWFTAFEPAGFDGIVAKGLERPYCEGRREMIKVKHRRTVDCVIGGYRLHKDGSRVGSILLGLYDSRGELHFIGHCSSFTAKEARDLLAVLLPLRAPDGARRRPRGRLWRACPPSGGLEPLERRQGPRIRAGETRQGGRGQLRPADRRPLPPRHPFRALAAGQRPARLHHGATRAAGRPRRHRDAAEGGGGPARETRVAPPTSILRSRAAGSRLSRGTRGTGTREGCDAPLKMVVTKAFLDCGEHAAHRRLLGCDPSAGLTRARPGGRRTVGRHRRGLLPHDQHEDPHGVRDGAGHLLPELRRISRGLPFRQLRTRATFVLGFPFATDTEDQGAHPVAFRAWKDGKPLAVTIGSGSAETYVGYYVHEATFPTGKTMIRVAYLARRSAAVGERFPELMPSKYDLPGIGAWPASYDYWLHTGAGWAGTIGTAVVRYTLADDFRGYALDVTSAQQSENPDWIPLTSPASYAKLDDRTYEWVFKDLEPTEKDDVELGFSELFWSDYPSLSVEPSMMGAVVTDTTTSNPSDQDSPPAWLLADGDPGSGIALKGESPWVKLAVEGDTRIREMRIVTGNNDSIDSFRQFARPKTIKVTLSDGTSSTIKLADAPSVQRFPISGTADWVRIDVLDSYPGSQSPDTCIAEISFGNQRAPQFRSFDSLIAAAASVSTSSTASTTPPSTEPSETTETEPDSSEAAPVATSASTTSSSTAPASTSTPSPGTSLASTGPTTGPADTQARASAWTVWPIVLVAIAGSVLIAAILLAAILISRRRGRPA